MHVLFNTKTHVKRTEMLQFVNLQQLCDEAIKDQRFVNALSLLSNW